MTEVFQASLAVERAFLREVVRAILGTILFHRVVGNITPSSIDVTGVTFPTPADPELQDLISAKTDLVVRNLLDGAAAAQDKHAKLYVSLYPTPLPSLSPSSRPHARTSAGDPISRSSSPHTTASSAANPSPSPTRTSHRRHAAALAAAAPGAVTSALGWFSASARAALSGAETAAGEAGAGQAGTWQDRQEDEARLLEQLKAQGKAPWEGWCIDFEVIKDGVGSRARVPSAAEERLRAQLNDFLLRSLEFSMLKTAHIPPITTADLMPFGVLILVDPPTPPFPVPLPVFGEAKAFPELHKALVTGGAGERGDVTQRRAASVGSRW